MQKIKKLLISASALALSFPIIASAQLTAPQSGNSNLPDLTGGQGAEGFLQRIIGILLLLAGLIAVLFLIIGGYQYITSGANEELAESGKKTLQNAIIGIIIIILSYTLVTIVFRTLTGYST